MKSKTCALYLWMSPSESTLLPQLRALKKATRARSWLIRRIYREQRFGSNQRSRPAWDRLCKEVESGRFNAVAVASIDRLGRNAREILGAIDFLVRNNIQVYVLDEDFVTGRPSGHVGIATLKAIVRCDQRLASKQTRMGLNEAKGRGRAIGRPRVYLAQSDLEDVRQGRRTAASLARDARVSVMTIRRRLAQVALSEHTLSGEMQHLREHV